MLGYRCRDLQPPAGLKAHSTRSMATSWALLKGVRVEDICVAASWASPHTFARFYRLDVSGPSLAHTVLETGASETPGFSSFDSKLEMMTQNLTKSSSSENLFRCLRTTTTAHLELVVFSVV